MQVGDLFDTFRVSTETVVRVAKIIDKVAYHNPSIMFVFIPGNHDVSRDADRVSSYQLLSMLVNRVNVRILTGHEPVEIFGVLFVPYSAFHTPLQQLEGLTGRYDAIVGHWDVIDFGFENPQLAPFERLFELTDTVITGHDHLPRLLERGDKRCLVTGSMQPYSHSEDPDEEWYLTRTAAEVYANPAAVRGKHLRVILEKDQVFDSSEIDPLALTFKYIDDITEETSMSLEEIFDLNSEVDLALSGLDSKVSQRIRELLTEARGV